MPILRRHRPPRPSLDPSPHYMSLQQPYSFRSCRWNRSTLLLVIVFGSCLVGRCHSLGVPSFRLSEQIIRPVTALTATRTDADLFTRQALFAHELLDRDEELALGEAIQRAHRVRGQMQAALEKKQALCVHEKEEAKRWTNDDEDEEDSDDDLSQLSIYGIAGNDDDYLEQERLEWFTNSRARLAEKELTSLSWEDDQWRELDQDLVDAFTDTEIMRLFTIAGGRQQVQAILSEGARARERLICSNTRLVLSIAKRWARQAARAMETSPSTMYAGSWDRPSLDEVVQEGILGLTRAVDKFQPKRGLRFATYATWWITSRVRQCFQNATTGYRVPVVFYETRSKYKMLCKKYFEADGEVPTMAAMAKELGITQSRLDTILRLTQTPLSTDAPTNRHWSPAGKSGGMPDLDNTVLAETLVDTGLKPDEMVDLSFLRQSLENAMASELAPYERDILRLRLGLDDGVMRSTRQIADLYGNKITMNEVRNAEKRAIKKLRSPHALANYKLLAYVDLEAVDIDRSTMTLR